MEVTHQKYKTLAKIIEEEVLCTPWNLSQSFITNNQQNGMMVLKDIGDPSNGNGGYSYLKLPLKMSQDTVSKGVTIAPIKSVTGTEADLRKLSKEQIHEMLKKLGYEQTGDISTMSRWKGVKALRERSSKAASLGIISSLTKFARGVRVTSKMQKESYQKQINEIFDRQLFYLTNEKPEISTDSDYEQPNKEEKALKSIAWDEIDSQSRTRNDFEETKDGKIQNDIRTQLVGNEEKEIKSVYDIPENKLREIYDKFNEDSHKCTVLKKVIREVDPETKVESLRVVYIFDDRQIKNFKKRVEKLQIKKKEKKNKKDKNVFGLSKSRTEGSNLINLRLDNLSEYDESNRSGNYNDFRISSRKEQSTHGRITIPLADDLDEEMDDVGADSDKQRNRDKSKSAKPKKSNKPAAENNQYLEGPKRQNTCSRRRQNTPLSQFNEILINIIDSLITFDSSQLFHNPVKKKDVPTYYDVIKNPMDLSTMKSKGKRCEYTTLDQLMEDFKLLRSNSETFNGADNYITLQATSILERAEILIQTDMETLKDLEIKIEQDEAS